MHSFKLKVFDVPTANTPSSLRLSYDQVRLDSVIGSAFAVENRWACEILSLQSRGFPNPTFFRRHEAFIATEILGNPNYDAPDGK